MTDFTPAQLEAYAKFLPECVSCGACCHCNFSWDVTYVVFSPGDRDRIPEDKADRLMGNHSILTRTYGKGAKARCACAMLDQRDHKRCTIYAQRPEICMTFRRGGPECIREYLAFHKKLGRDV